MGASIHINGTGSSIIDTVFVCRSTGSVPRKWIVDSPEGVAPLVDEDLTQLRAGNVKPTLGDIRCIAYGHLVRSAIWNLRKKWDASAGINKRIAAVSTWLSEFGGWPAVERYLHLEDPTRNMPLFATREPPARYRADDAEISF
jgi:hypothetical protein